MDLCQSKKMEPEDIYALAVAGNTAMTHLTMGLNPRWIIREPYIPVMNSPDVLNWLIACAGVIDLAAQLYLSGRMDSRGKLVPDLPLESYQPLGNSSLGGATLALTSEENLAEIDRIRDRITHLELNVNQDFLSRFSAAKFIPHTNTSLFPSVKTR